MPITRRKIDRGDRVRYRCPTFSEGGMGSGRPLRIVHEARCGQAAEVIAEPIGSNYTEDMQRFPGETIWLIRFDDGEEILAFAGALTKLTA